ncbi:MAG: hypothetical protein ACR2M1_06305 [Gemmatimonadaceae bacterium]
MSDQPEQPPAMRADDTMGRLGEYLGRSVSSALRRAEHAVIDKTSGRRQQDHTAVPEDPQPASSNNVPSSLPTARAEELLDRLVGQLSGIVVVSGQRLRHVAAVAREEAEDIWADAQQIHEESRRNQH